MNETLTLIPQTGNALENLSHETEALPATDLFTERVALAVDHLRRQYGSQTSQHDRDFRRPRAAKGL